jgi:hypothetical protein
MMATHRLKGLGWLASCAFVAIGFYLVSLQVAAERKRLEKLDARIVSAKRDIRALETEFDVRANLTQLERWNGDTLALTVPTAQQFVRSEIALASLSPNAPPATPASGDGAIRNAALIVPSTPSLAPATLPGQPGGMTKAAVVTTKPSQTPVRRYDALAATRAAPTSPASMKAAITVSRAPAGIAPRGLRTVAMVDSSLLSAGTLGDLTSGARKEGSRLR